MYLITILLHTGDSHVKVMEAKEDFFSEGTPAYTNHPLIVSRTCCTSKGLYYINALALDPICFL